MSAFLSWDNGNSSLLFDVVTQETQTKSTMITEHPVEAGANVTDHVRPELDRVTIEGFVSNTPIYGLNAPSSMAQIPLDTPDPPTPISINGAIDLLSSFISPKQQVVANVMTFGSANDFVAAVIIALDKLRLNATLVSVICPSFAYDNMIVESVEVNRDASSGTGASISVGLREIRTVKSSVTSAPQPSILRAKAQKARGAQEGDTPSTKKMDLLSQGLKLLGR